MICLPRSPLIFRGGNHDGSSPNSPRLHDLGGGQVGFGEVWLVYKRDGDDACDVGD